jgi:hypothetical protein
MDPERALNVWPILEVLCSARLWLHHGPQMDLLVDAVEETALMGVVVSLKIYHAMQPPKIRHL